MIRYFVSFSFIGAHGTRTGNCEILRPEPVRSMADVENITTALRQQGLHDPIVLSFSRFDTDVEETSTTNGPADGLAFDYIQQLLQEQGRPLSAKNIAGLLDFPVDATRRVLQNGLQAGRLVVTADGYDLPAGAR